MAINRQKLKLLYLMRMLEEETDAERGLTMAQIIGKLEALGISAERKSIYRDIEALREFGVDVRTYQRAPVEYAVEHRAFAFAELQLLVDAVQSSRFLTQRKSDALVEGVKQLASRRQRALLDKRVHVEGRIKMQNESVFGSVDRIQEAIALKRRISFVYFKYDAAKRKALQHNGERYIETPVQLVYAEGYYYLVVFNEKHDDFANYRVDRMDRIEVLDEPALKNERIATFDARELESRAFGMYSGEPVAATLLVDEEVMGAVIDRFGKDVESVPTGERRARVYATVMKSPVLFGWLAQFGGRVRIEKPTALAQEYRAYLPGAPTVLRFEDCDLAAFVMRAPHIALHVGSLETDAPVAGLRWKSLRPCSYAIGRQVSDLVFCTDENGLLVELEIVLDDGGRLVVGGGRPACEHDEEAMPQAV